jgi:hypothetical protein
MFLRPHKRELFGQRYDILFIQPSVFLLKAISYFKITLPPIKSNYAKHKNGNPERRKDPG